MVSNVVYASLPCPVGCDLRRPKRVGQSTSPLAVGNRRFSCRVPTQTQKRRNPIWYSYGRRASRPLFCSTGEGELERPPYQDLADSVAKGLGGANVYLIGMMGSGKSTVGSVIAKSLNYLFLDSDALIEKAAKCSIQEIFQSSGEEEFREIETSVLRDLHQYKKLVVGTGGGIVIRPMNWSYLHQGIVIFLNGPPEKLAYRVAQDGLTGRPLLSKTSDEEQSNAIDVAKEKLQTIYSQRKDMYKNADIEVSLIDPTSETGLAPVDEVVRRTLSQLQARLEEAKNQRTEKGRFEITGTSDLPDGRPTINAPSDVDRSRGIGYEE